jgi:coenzyme F420 biosynthesis associated uncharacterized protein
MDWERARSIAIAMNRGAALTAPERARLDDEFQRLTDRAIPVVGSYMGATLPPNAGKAHAFDRVDWINANVDAFRSMLAPLEPLLAGPQDGSRPATLWRELNRNVVGAELGILLGYLARRVLGQYDVALLGRERLEPSRLYYVEPNIRRLESSLQLPDDEFRLWLALHETTHVFQFEAVPWVRPHFNSMLERYFAYLREDAERLGEDVRNIRVFIERIRSRDTASGSWIEALMNDEQRALFAEMQAMMSVIEGYSNHVMNAVGRTMLPHFDLISRAFEQRQRNRSQAEQLFARITGLDLKIEQYRQGQAFIDAIVAQQGHDVARRVWQSPSHLPTLDELRNPESWVQRVALLDASISA